MDLNMVNILKELRLLHFYLQINAQLNVAVLFSLIIYN